MKLDNCQYDLETKMVDACDSCRFTSFQTHQTYTIGQFRLIVTRTYETKTCFSGFAPGDLINAFSLLPKEEQEVEIIRREKYSKALHEERSVESEFESEVQSTMRSELSASQDFNFSESAGGGFSFFGIGASASASASQSFGLDENFFNEVVKKTAAKVSSKYDIAVDTKTEIDNQYRSLRKITNPNPCRVVTFFFKQLNKKYTYQVSLVKITYDIINALPDVFTAQLPYYTKVLPNNLQQIQPVPTIPASVAATAVNAPRTLVLASATVQNAPHLEVATQNAKVLYAATDARPFKELTEEQLSAKAILLNVIAAEKAKVDELIKSLKVLPGYKPGIVFSTEYCIRTHNIMAEPKVSNCSICDCNEVGCSCKDKEPVPAPAK